MISEEIVSPTGTDVTLRRVSWGAIFAGAIAAGGTWMLLSTLGLAIGLSTAELRDFSSSRASGLFAGMWGAFAPLVALFIGGLVAGRGSGTFSRALGALHGFVTWGLTTVGGAWVAMSLTSEGRYFGSLTVRASWGLFIALLCSLIAATVGGIVGVRRWRSGGRPLVEREIVREPPLTGHEVYP